jgi:hypothetical protein
VFQQKKITAIDGTAFGLFYIVLASGSQQRYVNKKEMSTNADH